MLYFEHLSFWQPWILPLVMKPADSDSKPNPSQSDSRITLEAIISVGVLGWLTIGMVLMGLGIW